MSGCAAASYRKLNLYSTPRFEKSSLEHYLLSIRYVCRLNVSSLGSKGGTCSTHSTLQRSSNGILNTSAILSHELRARHTIIASYVFYHAVSLAFQPETSVSDHLTTKMGMSFLHETASYRSLILIIGKGISMMSYSHMRGWCKLLFCLGSHL